MWLSQQHARDSDLERKEESLVLMDLGACSRLEPCLGAWLRDATVWISVAARKVVGSGDSLQERGSESEIGRAHV